MASSSPSKDQCFLQGTTRTQGACMCAAWANQAGLNFHVDSEGADHTSVSRSDRTLNVYNYALQMHLCLQLFPGCLSGSVLEIPRLAEEVSRLSLFFQSRTTAGKRFGVLVLVRPGRGSTVKINNSIPHACEWTHLPVSH